MNYTEPFLRKVETAQEEQQHQHPQHQSGVSYRAAVAAKNSLYNNPKLSVKLYTSTQIRNIIIAYRKTSHSISSIKMFMCKIQLHIKCPSF